MSKKCILVFLSTFCLSFNSFSKAFPYWVLTIKKLEKKLITEDVARTKIKNQANVEEQLVEALASNNRDYSIQAIELVESKKLNYLLWRKALKEKEDWIYFELLKSKNYQINQKQQRNLTLLLKAESKYSLTTRLAALNFAINARLAKDTIPIALESEEPILHVAALEELAKNDQVIAGPLIQKLLNAPSIQVRRALEAWFQSSKKVPERFKEILRGSGE